MEPPHASPTPAETKVATSPPNASPTEPVPSATFIVNALIDRYRAAKTYSDTGTIEVVWPSDARGVQRMRFTTLFDRAATRFRFDHAVEGSDARTTIWRTGPRSVTRWSARDRTPSKLSLEDALYCEVPDSRERVIGAPAVLLLLGKPSQLFEGLVWRGARSELIGGQRSYRLVGDGMGRTVTMWVARNDYSLLRLVETHGSDRSGGEVEVTVRLTPSFDRALEVGSFDFVPPEVHAASDSCAERGVVADGSDPLIDDMADGDTRLRNADHRLGHWWVYGDESCDLIPADGARAAPPQGNNPDQFAMYVAARHCDQWGFGIGFPLNHVAGRCAYDASVYDGVYFWARSGHDPVPIRFLIGARNTQPIEYGGDGTCERTGRKECWQSHWAPITLTPDWRSYALRWRDLKEPEWELKTPFDARVITSMGWEATHKSPATPEEIWIGRVGFFKGAPPSAPFPSAVPTN